MKSGFRLAGAAWLTAALLAILLVPATPAAPLTTAKVTETKNVVLYRPQAGAERPAKVADVVQGADVLRTGERSLAEIEFSDKTLTRLGSKSVFTFSAATREFHPGPGTTLIYVPKGLGGGRIVTPAVTAAIEGTTVIVQEIELPPVPGQAAPRLLSKVIFLEGTGQVSLTQPKAVCPITHRRIGPGQMIVQLTDDPCLADVQDIDLDILVKRSGIVTAFSEQLPSLPLILAAVNAQNNAKSQGRLGPAGHGPHGPYSPTPPPGGIGDPVITGPGRQGSIIDVGDGFFLSSTWVPGSTKVQGGGHFFVFHR